ncbi:MAG: cytochrome b/b6 domain-containing protein [Desulfobulbus sp.]|uniref:cytochrome b/b6 domain-containing protein n=1 Tax=Desulfobulbus sp. TaxID=895 RepID=UPI00284406D3|nr:cytochrome b/b6 domain-containing protein [Desulfobulbus sp.]MDR2549600.1 cytochrome b/b6 domain-containing protein [Desulfobulbus sp.]
MLSLKKKAFVRKHSSAIVNPLWLRLMHWLNALAVILLVLSGWRIYDASPFLGFVIPKELTLGGWLAGALQWHFAAMWLLAINGIAYLLCNLLTGRLFKKFFPLSPREVLKDIAAALRGKFISDDLTRYTAMQRTAYLFIIASLVILVLSGLVLWKSVQFPLLREMLGGYEGARRVHFFAMAAVVVFFPIHLLMVALSPRALLLMIRGR